MHEATVTQCIPNDHKMHIQDLLVSDVRWRETGNTNYEETQTQVLFWGDTSTFKCAEGLFECMSMTEQSFKRDTV